MVAHFDPFRRKLRPARPGGNQWEPLAGGGCEYPDRMINKQLRPSFILSKDSTLLLTFCLTKVFLGSILLTFLSKKSILHKCLWRDVVVTLSRILRGQSGGEFCPKLRIYQNVRNPI